ncbi:hypothetical protein [Sporolactobacillus spathodeae]|uniref:Uncharacterized protein n=1 Tax=Sporolactobacillus spathodeae TaxID=1465502 RepID=A0ABS2Q5E7_9BACL|nr:hypothetical protein [Sporolactobacillus spathodeae]MBM7657002.1 hypothetical protein [Sporolactobacillus spathodeae]
MASIGVIGSLQLQQLFHPGQEYINKMVSRDKLVGNIISKHGNFNLYGWLSWPNSYTPQYQPNYLED